MKVIVSSQRIQLVLEIESKTCHNDFHSVLMRKEGYFDKYRYLQYNRF